MSDWYKEIDKSAEERLLKCDSTTVSDVAEVWNMIRDFHQGGSEGWFCYTSSLWLLEAGSGLDDVEYVSGIKNAKGTLLSCELHRSVNGVDETLSVRHGGREYQVVRFTLKRDSSGANDGDSEVVRACYQEFYGSLDQELYPNWKLRYRNCWGKVLRGEAPHQVEVYEPLVGIFVGFNKGGQ